MHNEWQRSIDELQWIREGQELSDADDNHSDGELSASDDHSDGEVPSDEELPDADYDT